jgi:uncharacterized DUF497 family protein
VAITFDLRKRDRTLAERGLDFAEAESVLDGSDRATAEDDRRDYGETRYITAGYLHERMVVIVWTPRGADRHVISMRHCHADEEKIWRAKIDQASGMD